MHTASDQKLEAGLARNKATILAGGILEPRLSVPDFVSQLWTKIQSCEAKSGTESLGFEARVWARD